MLAEKIKENGPSDKIQSSRKTNAIPANPKKTTKTHARRNESRIFGALQDDGRNALDQDFYDFFPRLC